MRRPHKPRCEQLIGCAARNATLAIFGLGAERQPSQRQRTDQQMACTCSPDQETQYSGGECINRACRAAAARRNTIRGNQRKDDRACRGQARCARCGSGPRFCRRRNADMQKSQAARCASRARCGAHGTPTWKRSRSRSARPEQPRERRGHGRASKLRHWMPVEWRKRIGVRARARAAAKPHVHDRDGQIGGGSKKVAGAVLRTSAW